MDDFIPKPAEFIESALKDLREMPDRLRQNFGRAIFQVQCGETPDNAKPLKGFRGAGVIELVENHDTDTYRAAYTVRFAEVVYVLHVFQKKSKVGIATPQRDLELIAARLKKAEGQYAQRQKNQSTGT